MEDWTDPSWLLLQLKWTEIIIVSDGKYDVLPLTQTLGDDGVQHVLVTGSEALSGEWVRDVVKTGVDSWRPVHLLLMCSVTCIVSALTLATQLDESLGTLTAFGMTSRWLLVSREPGHLMASLQDTNITMDNVALLHYGMKRQTYSEGKVSNCTSRPLTFQTLQWSRKKGREWTLATNMAFGTDITEAHQEPGTFRDLDGLLFPNMRYGFNGRRLRVVVKEWMSYVTLRQQNQTKVWSGLLMDYLILMSNALNFTYELVDATDDEWGSGTSNDSDRGFFGYVTRKVVDIGLVSAIISWRRSEVLDFPEPLVFSSAVMVYRKPRVTDTHNMPLGPLSTPVVIGVLVALMTVTLLLWYLEMASAVIHMKRETDCLKAVSNLDKVLQLTGAALLSEPSEKKLTSRGGRVLLWSWWMLSLVVTAAYSGTLTAFLSVNRQPLPFSRLEDLLTKSHSYTWGVFPENNLRLTLESSTNPVYSDLWAGIQRFYQTDPSVLGSSSSELAKKVRNEDFVFFGYRPSSMDMFKRDCDLVMKEVDFGSSMISYALPKGSALIKPFSDIIMRLHSNGVSSHLFEKWFPQATCSTPTGPMVISLMHLEGMRFVLPVALGLALLGLAAELLCFKSVQQA